ncbi:MAG: hypothetical protein OXI71_16340 [Gemmatimonadota bacterium]|nr:hypothetical protein [Gemmatimonadota bacterium]
MPGKRKRPDQPQHDAAYKNFFTHSQTVADTLRLAAGELARRLDFATLARDSVQNDNGTKSRASSAFRSRA